MGLTFLIRVFLFALIDHSAYKHYVLSERSSSEEYFDHQRIPSKQRL